VVRAWSVGPMKLTVEGVRAPAGGAGGAVFGEAAAVCVEPRAVFVQAAAARDEEAVVSVEPAVACGREVVVFDEPVAACGERPVVRFEPPVACRAPPASRGWPRVQEDDPNPEDLQEGPPAWVAWWAGGSSPHTKDKEIDASRPELRGRGRSCFEGEVSRPATRRPEIRAQEDVMKIIVAGSVGSFARSSSDGRR